MEMIAEICCDSQVKSVTIFTLEISDMRVEEVLSEDIITENT